MCVCVRDKLHGAGVKSRNDGGGLDEELSTAGLGALTAFKSAHTQTHTHAVQTTSMA